MSAIVVDTSVWVGFFRGRSYPALEEALGAGLVILSPIVCAELLSAPLEAKQRRDLRDFLDDLALPVVPREHWYALGDLRSRARKAGLTLSIPDAQVGQCAIDAGGRVWSEDSIFHRLGAAGLVRLFAPE